MIKEFLLFHYDLLKRRLYVFWKRHFLLMITLLLFPTLYFFLILHDSPSAISPNDLVNLTTLIKTPTYVQIKLEVLLLFNYIINTVFSYVQQRKFTLTQWEAYFAGCIGIVMLGKMAKTLNFPISSDSMALIFCLTECAFYITHLIFIYFQHQIWAFIIHLILLGIINVKLILYLRSTQVFTGLRGHFFTWLFIIACFTLGILHLLVGFNTLNDPVQIDIFKLKTQLFLMVFGTLYYLNQHTSIYSITVSTTSDSSPFKAANVTITIKKGFYFLSKFKTITGIHSHSWTEMQVIEQGTNVDDFEASINHFNTQIPTMLGKIKIGDQLGFDTKMQEMFHDVDVAGWSLPNLNAHTSNKIVEVPFLKDIIMAASIAFVKASSYCESVEVYEY